MRVLLVQAPSVEGPHAEIVAPLGLGAVAAAARGRGHTVDLVDLNLETDPFPALAAALRRVDPEVVGIGLRNIDPLANRRHSYLPAFGALLEVVRRELPSVPVVVGGAGFSMFPRTIMERYPAVDVGVVLEGEETFPEVLSRLGAGAAGSGRAYPYPASPGPASTPARARADGDGMRAYLGEVAGTPGTIVRLGAVGGPGEAATHATAGAAPPSRLVTGPRRPRLARAALDAPRRWLPELAAAYAGRTDYAPAAGVETKRGCPLGCSYCVYPALQGKRLRYRSPETIVAEVEMLNRETGAEWVHFTDPVLNHPAPHFREVCRLLVERRVPVRWTGFFREDALTAADAELAVRAGCAAFQFSGDGTCDRTMSRLRKGLSTADVLAAARAVAATDALAVYHFMVNVPGTDADIAERAHLLVDRLHDIHSPRRNLGAIVFNNLRVYPGTGLARELVASGCLDPRDHLLFPTYHDPAPFQHLRYELEERHHRHATARADAAAASSGPALGAPMAAIATPHPTAT